MTSVSARKAAANTRRFAVVAACLAATQAAGAEPDAALVVEQPRAFGHFLGDRLQQRILLERRGISLQPIALPQRSASASGSSDWRRAAKAMPPGIPG